MAALLWLLALLISYGSLYPFGFAAHEGSLEELSRLFIAPELSMGRGDLVGNLLLFVPWGFIATLHARSHPRPQQQLAWLLVLGGLLALALQIIQIWLPSRVPALVDVLANLGGMAIGVAAAELLPRLLPAQQQRALRDRSTPHSLAAAALMLCWLGYQWFPLVPTLDLQNLLNALKPLLHSPRPELVRSLHGACAWLAFFWLGSLLFKPPLSRLAIAAGSLLILAGKLFIVGAGISASNALGFVLALAAAPLLQHRHGPAMLIVLLLLSLLLSGLSPFELHDSARAFHWIPFTGMLEGSMMLNLLNLLEKSYLYGALILLMHHRGARLAGASMAVALWLLLIEGLQVFSITRTPESTDPVLALLLGFAFSRLLSRPSRRSPRQ